MAVFAVPCETADATAATAAGFTAATAAGAFADPSAKPAAATDSLRPGPGFAAFPLPRFMSLECIFMSLDATRLGSLWLPAPAVFRGAVAGLTTCAAGIAEPAPFPETTETTPGDSVFPRSAPKPT